MDRNGPSHGGHRSDPGLSIECYGTMGPSLHTGELRSTGALGSRTTDKTEKKPKLRTRKSTSSILASLALIPLAFIPFTLSSIFSSAMDELCYDTNWEDANVSAKLMDISIFFAAFTGAVFISRLMSHYTFFAGCAAARVIDRKLRKQPEEVVKPDLLLGRGRSFGI